MKTKKGIDMERAKPKEKGKSAGAKNIKKIDVAPIIEKLRGGTDKERYEAVKKLGKVGDSDSISALISVLADNAKISVRAESAILDIGKPALGLLVETIGNPSMELLIRRRAIRTIAKMRDPSAIPNLEKLMEPGGQELDSDLDYEAVYALGQIGDSSAIPSLERVVRQGNPDLKSFALEALGELGNPSALPVLLGALNSRRHVLVNASISGIRRLASKTDLEKSSSVVSDLIKVSERRFTDGQFEFSLIRNVMYALGEFGSPSAVPFLIENLESQDFDERRVAATALGKIGGQDAVQALVKSLKDRVSLVRRDALDAISNLGDYGAIISAIYTSNKDMRNMLKNSIKKLIEKCDSLDWIQEFLVRWDGLSIPGSEVALSRTLKEDELDSIRKEILAKAVEKEKELRGKK